VNADAKALADFSQRVKAYADLHVKLEQTLPKLSKDSTPQEIDKHQRALAALVQKARATAKRGEIFGSAESVFRAICSRVFKGEDGAEIRASINDENMAGMKLAVNQRYPDTIPLSTIPPQFLEAVPKLPEEIEYRFIGDRLILLDGHAHTVADYIDNVLPK
jgi:hypothetical protein